MTEQFVVHEKRDFLLKFKNQCKEEKFLYFEKLLSLYRAS